MEHISSHTLNENGTYEKDFFSNFLQRVKEKTPYLLVYPSFEQYYYIGEQALKYYGKSEDYESCKILQENLSEYLSYIPKNSSEAVKFLVKTVGTFDNDFMAQVNEFSLAINLHKSTGARIIDLWLLRRPEVSPLVQYYQDEHNFSNHDQIANDILLKYVRALKAKIEYEKSCDEI